MFAELEVHGRRRADGTVWAVGMARDEADIIGHTIEHLLAQGVDRVLLADNGSVDGTGEIARDVDRDRVIVVDDPVREYFQAQKTTRLARLATAAGASWIVPFDADELWCANDGLLAEHLRASNLDVVRAAMYDQVPSADDDTSQPNPYLRIRRRMVEAKVMGKVAFRAHRWAFVETGNHSVRHPGREIGDGLVVRHVPCRTVEQAIRKVRQGTTALTPPTVDASIGVHWRALDALTDEEIIGYYSRLTHATLDDPAPFTARRH